MIETQNGAKEVHMSLKTVKGLTQLNSTENRKDHQYDKAFIKVLLVDLIGIRQIKELGVDGNILKLIKSMFSEHLKKIYHLLLIIVCFICRLLHGTHWKR